MSKIVIIASLVILGFTLTVFASDPSQNFISSKDFMTVKTILEKTGIPLEAVWKIADFEGDKVVGLDLSVKTKPAVDYSGINSDNDSLNTIKPIYYVPSEIGELKSLRKLNLDGNKLTTLPNEIGKLENLEILSVQRNFLVELPLTLGDLKSLTVLNLSGNQLNALPQAIFTWSNLEILDLSTNKLRELPEEIGELRSLRYLYVQENPLNTIPVNFTGLNLKGFNVSSGMLRSINPEMKNWVFANRSEQGL